MLLLSPFDLPPDLAVSSSEKSCLLAWRPIGPIGSIVSFSLFQTDDCNFTPFRSHPSTSSVGFMERKHLRLRNVRKGTTVPAQLGSGGVCQAELSGEGQHPCERIETMAWVAANQALPCQLMSLIKSLKCDHFISIWESCFYLLIKNNYPLIEPNLSQLSPKWDDIITNTSINMY